MHKNITLTLGGLAIIGVIAGASYISGGSLLSSVLTSTQPVCQEQENDVALATQALEQYPERKNIAERVSNLQQSADSANKKVEEAKTAVSGSLKKTRYTDLDQFMIDYNAYVELKAKWDSKNNELKSSQAAVVRLSRVRPRTAEITSQIQAEQTKQKALTKEISQIKTERTVLNAKIKKITKSATTIDVLYTKYIKKSYDVLSAAEASLKEAKIALDTVLAEQTAIKEAEKRLADANTSLSLCTGKPGVNPDTKNSTTYCFPTYQGSDGTIQKNCVDDISKIPQCYVKSTTTEIYDDETGELSSVNVVSDDNTKELYFCGTPDTAYLDPANPTSGYPTIPGQGSNPGAEAAAPMGAENPNNPKKNPGNDEDDDDTPRTCPSGVVVYDNAKCPEDAICGNYKCEYGEDKISCPIDCDSGWGTDAGEECGNGKVDEGEDCDDGNKEGNWNDSCQGCMFHCDSRAITDAAGHRVRPNLLVLKYGRPKSRAETVMQFVPFATDLNDKLKDDSRQCLYTNLPACGNGKIDTYDKNPEFPPEECDLGDNNGKPGFDCTSGCQRTFCGDGEVTGDEVCDTQAPGESEATCIDNCSSTVQRPL